MDIHSIRLRGPWQAVSLENGARSQVRLPMSWDELHQAGYSTGCIFRRRFQAPTGLAPTDRVWLCFAQFPDGVEIRLNGAVLGVVLQRESAWDVTDGLALTNLLEVEVGTIPAGDRSIGEVALQIRSRA